MSYHIYYRGLAIALPENKFCIVAENGCNNLYTGHGRSEKRVRNWTHCYIVNDKKKSFQTTMSEIETELKRIYDEGVQRSVEYAQTSPNYKFTPTENYGSDFGYMLGLSYRRKTTHQTTLADALGFYRSAIRNAKTIEEYAELGISFEFETFGHGKPRQTKNIHTTADFFEGVKEFEGLDGGYHLKGNVYEYSWTKLKPKKVRKPLAATDEAYIVTVPQYGFLAKLSSRRFWYTQYRPSAKKYLTKKAAEHAAATINHRFEFTGVTAAVEKFGIEPITV